MMLVRKDMIKAVKERNTNYDGVFFACVKTTGIYCFPSCGARIPKNNNIEFVENSYKAEIKGYRSCKQCKP